MAAPPALQHVKSMVRQNASRGMREKTGTEKGPHGDTRAISHSCVDHIDSCIDCVLQARACKRQDRLREKA